MNIKQLQEYAINKLKQAGVEEPILKTKLLVAYVLDKTKEYLLIHQDEEIDKEIVETFNNALEKLSNRIPLAYIMHSQEFMRMKFYVDENVLIPRQDTEVLVEKVMKTCKENSKILDMCTGSGAIAISLAKYIPQSSVTASDISIEALKIAKRNANSNNVKVSFIESDLFENIEEKEWDVIVSNPPYIETDVIKSLQQEVQMEPIIALDGGVDGLDFYRKIITDASSYLIKGGILALEIGYNQAEKVTELLKENRKYSEIEVIKDLAGNDRVIIAKLK